MRVAVDANLAPCRAATLLAAAVSLSSLLGCMGEPTPRTELSSNGADCASCHLDEWSATSDPVHAQLGFGTECGQCHDERQWQPARGYAHKATFPLTNAHAEPPCSSCHAGGFEPGTTSTQCVDCHLGQANRVVDPIHKGLTTDCFGCHRTDSFAPAHFVHSWPLKGVHALTSCRSCHGAEPARYQGIGNACVGCHADDQQRANQSVAGHAGFGSGCATCHTPEGFKRR